MKVLIYYFTGTCNSLLVAKKIAERINGAEVRPIMELYGLDSDTDKTSVNCTLLEANAVGFVFPVYFGRIPEIVSVAIKKAQFSEKQYFFAAATCNGMVGNALFELDLVLRSKGVRLDYGKAVDMPDNTIIIRTSEAKANRRIVQINNAADEFTYALSRGIKRHDFKRKGIFNFGGRVSKFVVMRYYKAEKRKIDMSRCNKCGMCTKICPVGNFSIQEEKVLAGVNCKWCFGCINWCPKSAIVFGRIDPSKRMQYHCQGISVADIAQK